MKKNMKSAVFLALCFLIMASFAMAIPVACDTIASGTNVNPGGNTTSIDCTSGGLEFSNFQYSVAGGSGTPEIDFASVTLNGGWVLLSFNPNLGFPSAINILHFTFAINGVVFGSAVDNAGLNSSIQESNCAGAGTTGLNTCTGPQLWNTGDTDNQSTSCVGSSLFVTCRFQSVPGIPAGTNGATCGFGLGGQNGIATWNAIIVGPGGSQTSFSEGFLGSGSGSIPEPMTLSLMGAGLLGLGLLRRRMKKK